METRFILLLLVSIILGCKGKTEKVLHEPVVVPVEKTQKLPSEILKIMQFAGISHSDSVDIHSQIRFKTLDLGGTMETVDMDMAIELYKTRFKSGKGDEYPIFEVNNFEDVIITTVSKGYGGNIRGTFLIHRQSLEIRKAEFEHLAESEGYGAVIADASFENQFVGTKIQFGKNTFGLNQNGKHIIKGAKTIDGISGATTTSRLTINMVNDELKKYKTYFQQKP